MQHENNSLETMGWGSAALDVEAGYCAVSFFFETFIVSVVLFCRW